MAYSVAIVDDEKLVTYGLKSLLSEDGSPFEVSGAWYSGTEALRHCLESPPDLLLTDISMPGLDGLGLIRELRLSNASTRIVVLSCHDEYAMVHKAFLLGADDYILKKDITKDSLYKVLQGLIPENHETSGSYEKKTTLPGLDDVSDRICESGGLIGVMGFKREFDTDDRELPWQADFPMLFQVVRDGLTTEDCCCLGDDDDLLIHLAVEDGAGLPTNTVDPRFERIRSTVSLYINRRLYVAQIDAGGFTGIRDAYLSGKKILKSMFYTDRSAVLLDGIGACECTHPLVFLLTTTSHCEDWRDAFNLFLSEAQDSRCDPGAVKDEVIFALKHLLHRLRENRGSREMELPVDHDIPYHQRIGHFDDMEHLRIWVLKYLDDIARSVVSQSCRQSPVVGIRNYIAEHIADDLQLNTVSGRFHLNANYLSSVFRKETGESYIDYVNCRRVERACELLETTDLSAKEIAYRCGYQNPNYFSRVFKKTTGNTVSDHRKSKNDNP